MKYPLCTFTFNPEQGQQINQYYMPTLLTRTDFNKQMTKRLLFFGPPNLRAFGFTDTFTDQGIAHPTTDVDRPHNDKIAKTLYISLEQLQLTMGVSGKPFQFGIGPARRYIDLS